MSFDASKGQFTGTAMAVVLDRTSITVATPLISKSENQQTSSGGSTVIPPQNIDISVEDGIFDLSLLNRVFSVAPYTDRLDSSHDDEIYSYVGNKPATGDSYLSFNSAINAFNFAVHSEIYTSELFSQLLSLTRNSDTSKFYIERDMDKLCIYPISNVDKEMPIIIGDYFTYGNGEYIKIDDYNQVFESYFTSSRFGKSKTTYAEFNADGELGINTAGTIGAKLHVKTTSTYGKEAVKIEQVDQDQAFIDYEGTSAANTTKNICTMNGGGALSGPRLNNGTDPGFAYAGMIKIEINGTSYWMPYFSIDNP